MPEETALPRRRFELDLRRPRIGWHPRPTVVFDGHGHPAQWGVGTWQTAADGSAQVSVYLFNRVWRYGSASAVVTAEGPTRLVYRAPLLPFLPGSLRAEP